MRNHGTLTKWDDERGFGFITPGHGAGELFVHISAFPRDGVRPRVNEVISFETELGQNGKQRAVRVMRPGSNRSSRATRTTRQTTRKSSAIGKMVLISLAAVGSLFGYSQYEKNQALGEDLRPPATSSISAEQSFQCDGRQHCSQMRSCAEAKYFIENCPNTKMDGDRDGIPCEQDLCASSW